jgi:hypothetical protein
MGMEIFGNDLFYCEGTKGAKPALSEAEVKEERGKTAEEFFYA